MARPTWHLEAPIVDLSLNEECDIIPGGMTIAGADQLDAGITRVVPILGDNAAEVASIPKVMVKRDELDIAGL